MKMGRPLRPLNLSDEVRSELKAISGSRILPHSLVRRAKIILMSDIGLTNLQIGQKLGLSYATIGKWRNRYCAQGLMGLYDEMRPGGPRSISDQKIARLIGKTLKTKPRHATHWTCRSIGAETGLSKSTVQRVWKAFGLQPHRQKHFRLSNDPFFVEKVRDVCRALPQPARQCYGALCGREKPGPSIRSNATDSATGFGLRRRRNSQLHQTRDNDAVCCSRDRLGKSVNTM